jgi:hypothetical protein
LRTGHGYFKSYFRRFSIDLGNYKCSCGEDNQTRTHLLLQCDTYKDARHDLIKTDPNIEWTAHSLLHTEEGIKKTLAFVTTTGVATRGWFTRENEATEDNEEDTWNNLDIGMGKLGNDNQEESESEVDEEGLAAEIARGPFNDDFGDQE